MTSSPNKQASYATIGLVTGLVLRYFLSWNMILLLIIFIVSIWHLATSGAKGGGREDYTKTRRMSLMTNTLAKGSYPVNSGVPHTVIHGIMWMKKLPTTEGIKRLITEKILMNNSFGRFLCPVIDQGSQCIWQKAVNIDQFPIDEHVFDVYVNNEKELLQFVEGLLLKPLNMSRPVWEFYVLHNQDPTGEGRSAVVPRIHHAIGDGISMLNVIQALLTDEEGNPFQMQLFTKRGQGEGASASAGVSSGGGGGQGEGASASGTSGSSLQSESYRSTLKTTALQIAMVLYGSIMAAVKLLLLPVLPGDSAILFRDTSTPYKWSGRRRIVISPPIDLAVVKSIKQKLNATVNDVITSVLAGGLRRYLEHRRDPLVTSTHSSPKVSVAIPYAFPRSCRPGESALRNMWTFIIVPLALGHMDPITRLRETKKRIDFIKSTPEPYLTVALQKGLSMLLPQDKSAETALQLVAKNTAVFTNVPGPNDLVYLGGSPVDDLNVVLANAIAQISVVSYNGHFAISFVIDDQVVIDSDRLPEFIAQELQALARASDV